MGCRAGLRRTQRLQGGEKFERGDHTESHTRIPKSAPRYRVDTGTFLMRFGRLSTNIALERPKEQIQGGSR